jgi:hypothetical protein
MTRMWPCDPTKHAEGSYMGCAMCEVEMEAEIERLRARLAIADAAHEAFDHYQDVVDGDPEVLPITKPGHIPLPPSTAAWRKFCDAKNAWREQRTTKDHSE